MYDIAFQQEDKEESIRHRTSALAAKDLERKLNQA
jgi:hypothetical protein